MSESFNSRSEEELQEIINYYLADGEGLIGQLGNISLNRAFESSINDKSGDLGVANDLINAANILLVLDRPKESISMLEMFEAMQIAETAETRDIYTLYRCARMRLCGESSKKPDAGYLSLIINEQEQSPVNNKSNSLKIHKTAFELGYDPSYAQYLELAFAELDLSNERESQYDPTPPMAEVINFIENAFLRDLEYLEDHEIQSAEFKEYESTAQNHINILVESFRKSKRKAAIANKLGNKLHYFFDDSKSLSTRNYALNSYALMCAEGIESTADRDDEDITYCRIHKNLIMRLINLSFKYPELYLFTENKFNEWIQNGLIKDRGLKRVQSWSTQEAYTHKPKKTNSSKKSG